VQHDVVSNGLLSGGSGLFLKYFMSAITINVKQKVQHYDEKNMCHKEVF
jgi:hypothetical protein